VDRTMSETLSSFVYSLKYEEIPETVVLKAKYLLLDTIGLCLAASKLEITAPILQVMSDWGGKAESTVLGTSLQLPAPNAALLNAMNAHALDFDDTHFRIITSITHPSSSIVPSVLAMGEALGATGKQIISGMVVGWEIMARLAMAGSLQKRGFFATSACAGFAVSLAVGKIIKLNEEKLAGALGVSGVQASGITEFRAGGDVKRFYPAWAAHCGIYAARIAEKGFLGPKSVLDGEKGFLNVFLGPGNYNENAVTEKLKSQWETLNNVIKLYPCNIFTHPFIECALDIHRELRSPIDEIHSIDCYYVTPQEASRVCEPIQRKKRPMNEYEARFSLPFCVALAMCNGKVNIESFEQGLYDQGIVKLADKVRYHIIPDSTSPMENKGSIHVKTKTGRIIEAVRVKHGAKNKTHFSEVVRKFRNNCSSVLSVDKTEEVIKVVLDLENGNVSELIRLCAI